MQNNPTIFKAFLITAFDNGTFATDDVIAFVLPLFEEVLSFHESKLVASFEREEALFITENRLDIDENLAHSPQNNIKKIEELFAIYKSSHFDVVGKTSLEADVDKGNYKVENLQLHLNTNEPLKHPAYLKGYHCFEQLLAHHDVMTDIFCLGLVLGSVALGLDLYETDDLENFVNYRRNPVQFNQRIHPTISTLITEMTELDRQKRSADLYDIIHRLKHYREYDPEKQTDLGVVAGWVNREIKDRHQFILSKLRNRLFDTSRRNRLLFYKPNMRFVNLTVSSVPLVLHYQSIRPELLFTWNEDVALKVKGMKEIVLNKYLRFEDHKYLPASLDKIRVESQRDVQEFGFSQLKLVVAFLNWHNLKEDIRERIQSPLLLLPVEMKKTKRLKEDHYSIKVLDNAAEVNPVLANQLRELYGIKLPDFVEMEEMELQQFYEILKAQIDAANQGIQLHYIDKPKIKLVHTIAKQTVTNYNKRLRKTGNQLDSYKNIAYSYQQEHYKPLGLELFKERIELRSSFLEFLINDDINLASNHLTGSNDRERELFEITESESNPYSWDFDVCNIVLGNFNYKKMSLVRDYTQIVDKQIQHNVFEELFTNHAKEIKQEEAVINNPTEWYHIITADPTQTKAIQQGRNGQSYIIQGPPGTGKSQTITNLIADFVARGKNILFVCEKRAALDVVYHRLKQNGLDELCCYIHDSQSDKREFIKNLKETYEDFLKNRLDLNDIEAQRNRLLSKMIESISVLEQFHHNNSAIPEDAGVSVRNLVERLIDIKKFIIPLQPKQQELVPGYQYWLQFGEIINELCSELEESGADASFADHAFSKLNDTIITSENPLHLLDNSIQQAKRLSENINETIIQCNIEPAFCNLFSQVKNLIHHAVLLEPLAAHQHINLVQQDNEAAKTFDEKIKKYNRLKQQYSEAVEKNKSWKNKFAELDVHNAIPIAEKHEKSFFKFLNSSWKQLKREVHNSYDFANHQVKPSVASILQQLKDEYAAADLLQQHRMELQQHYQLDNIDTTYLSIELFRSKQFDRQIEYLLSHPAANDIVLKLSKLNNPIFQLEQQLKLCLFNYVDKPMVSLRDELGTIEMNMEILPDMLPALRHFATIPDELKNMIRLLPLNPKEAEAILAQKSLQQLYQQKKSFASIDFRVIEKTVQQIQLLYRQLLKINAAYIRAKVRQRFIAHVELSNTALSQLNPEQKVFKKNYNDGRKILENEFGKTMRYKSIRELSAKDSGLVLKDIKTVWLMSPLSVSDSLPLDTNYFDVVVFDEASQITLEEGIPALYRAPQTIIVGDDKQMPPTNFFTAKTADPDDLESFGDETGEELLSSDADSLLVQGSRKLSSTMLSWHYRSHYETLISYSNHAFYNAGLLTIPDKTIHHNEKTEIEVTQQTDAAKFVDALYDRSISFHFHPASVYEKRNNQDEANYIAQLVRALLTKKVKETIGIVAFSQEQQHTIEDALTTLAQTDNQFELLLEEAYSRTDEDQFVGLIVKNLENIQGDERDIIIMSVCYGFDTRKKMLMNFGPINKKGGEKRLNVIFSRAKKHMAIVSSIKHHHITNEYNEGANYFRRFLHYAESVSNGNMQLARTILDSLVISKSTSAELKETNIVAKEITQRLEKLGYEVATAVGQSDFKCSLAIKAQAQDEAYTLGILIDDEQHYRNVNIVEQYYQRPNILQSFGWRCMHVFAKDWLQEPEKILEQIVKRIKENPMAEIEIIHEADKPVEEPIISAEKNIEADVPTQTQVPGYENVIFERLVYQDEKSNKFWEVGLHETKLIVRFGKLGTKGQVQLKSYESLEKVQKEKEKLMREKIAKGYLKIG